MQAASNIFLGWVRVKGPDGPTRDYYVRQLHDWKGADVERLRVTGTTLYARLCGASFARAHARWGDRIAIASYLGKGAAFDQAIAGFSAAYADQNGRDFDAFVSAINRDDLSHRQASRQLDGGERKWIKHARTGASPRSKANSGGGGNRTRVLE